MRIACVLIHNLAVQISLIGDPNLHGRPLIIGGLPFEAKPVYDASAEAMACGIEAGILLPQAHALCPQAIFLSSDGRRDEGVFEKVVKALERFSPVVDIEETGCAYLDVTGVQNEQTLAREIAVTISSNTRLSACLGISSGKFFSRVAALSSRPEAPVIVAQEKERGFIAPFSIDFLPCSAETKERLHFLGIRFIGQLGQFSREALAAQFGSDGILMHELALGVDKALLAPRKKPWVITDTAELDPPAFGYVEVLQSCQAMLGRLLTSMEAQGRLCREILLKVKFGSDALHERRLPLKEATSSSTAILRRLQTWLEGIQFPAPATQVELCLFLTREEGKRLYLWPEQKKAGQQLGKLASELKARFGCQPLKKVQAVQPNAILPERRFRLTDVLE